MSGGQNISAAVVAAAQPTATTRLAGLPLQQNGGTCPTSHADLNGDGVCDGDVAKTPDHCYGCSGIDAVSFGAAFGRTDGPPLQTVAYGIYSNVTRTDNDHQVLLQYDFTDWTRYQRPLTEAARQHSGPSTAHGEYFVRTGMTSSFQKPLAPRCHRSCSWCRMRDRPARG